jgi:hypothetical protein
MLSHGLRSEFERSDQRSMGTLEHAHLCEKFCQAAQERFLRLRDWLWNPGGILQQLFPEGGTEIEGLHGKWCATLDTP